MAVKNLKNLWGVSNGLEPQRADLWQIDLDSVATEVSGRITDSGGVFSRADSARRLNGQTSFYASSVTFPELTVNAVEIRQDSRPFNMPSWDAPVGLFNITFIHDVGRVKQGDISRSEIYTLLESWRALVRAGRGSMSNLPSSASGLVHVDLDQDYKIKFRFDIPVTLLRGAGQFDGKGGVTIAESDDVEISTRYVLKKAWLSTLKISDLTYRQSEMSTVSAGFYCADIVAQ
jgi:hypothetical protein